MNKYSICYVSRGHDNLSASDIETIFNTTCANNDRNNIKGILLHDFGHFFQVLEGEESVIKNLFENTICKDLRHNDISVIFERKVEEILFSNYSSKFNVIKTPEELGLIKKYLIKKTGKASDKVLRVLKPFLLYQVA